MYTSREFSRMLPNAFNLIVFTFYSFRYFVYVQTDFISIKLNNCFISILLSVYILNVHGLGETNSLRIRYSVLPFYTTCANWYTCRLPNIGLMGVSGVLKILVRTWLFGFSKAMDSEDHVLAEILTIQRGFYLCRE